MKLKQKILNNKIFLDIDTLDLQGELREQEPMSRHTSWKTGGNADYYYIASDIKAVSYTHLTLPTNREV